MKNFPAGGWRSSGERRPELRGRHDHPEHQPAQDTLECLASLAEATVPANHVIVLDNASTRWLRRGDPRVVPPDARSLRSRPTAATPATTTSASKRRWRRPEWVLVLNEDTILGAGLPRSSWSRLARPIPASASSGRWCIHHDEPDVIQSAGGRLGPHLGIDPPRRRTKPTAGSSRRRGRRLDLGLRDAGAAGRSSSEVGMLDERFFYYWEETEWCLRARKAGWQIVHVPARQAVAQGRAQGLQAEPQRHLLQHQEPVPDDVQAPGARLRSGPSSGARHSAPLPPGP